MKQVVRQCLCLLAGFNCSQALETSMFGFLSSKSAKKEVLGEHPNDLSAATRLESSSQHRVYTEMPVFDQGQMRQHQELALKISQGLEDLNLLPADQCQEKMTQLYKDIHDLENLPDDFEGEYRKIAQGARSVVDGVADMLTIIEKQQPYPFKFVKNDALQSAQADRDGLAEIKQTEQSTFRVPKTPWFGFLSSKSTKVKNAVPGASVETISEALAKYKGIEDAIRFAKVRQAVVQAAPCAPSSNISVWALQKQHPNDIPKDIEEVINAATGRAISFAKVKHAVSCNHDDKTMNDDSIEEALTLYPDNIEDAIKFAKLRAEFPPVSGEIIQNALTKHPNDFGAQKEFAMKQTYDKQGMTPTPEAIMLEREEKVAQICEGLGDLVAMSADQRQFHTDLENLPCDDVRPQATEGFPNDCLMLQFAENDALQSAQADRDGFDEIPRTQKRTLNHNKQATSSSWFGNLNLCGN